jgi:uncharacterized protein YoxC
MLVQTVVFLIPVIILFYKFGRRDQVLDEVVKDVNGIGIKIADIRDNHNHALAELKAQIESVNNTMIKIDTWLDVIKQTLEELKRKK